MRVSLDLRAEMERHARCAIEAEEGLVETRVAARTAVRMRKGVSLVAMAVLILRTVGDEAQLATLRFFFRGLEGASV